MKRIIALAALAALSFAASAQPTPTTRPPRDIGPGGPPTLIHPCGRDCSPSSPPPAFPPCGRDCRPVPVVNTNVFPNATFTPGTLTFGSNIVNVGK